MGELANKQIEIQAKITAPYEGYLYILGRPIFELNFGKKWNSGMRGKTTLLGKTYAKVDVISNEEIDHVIFCIDDEFLFWDAEPPYEWKIIGWYLAIATGRHKLRVFAYTESGKVGYDEMDLLMFTKTKYRGKWPPAQPCDPNPENGAKNIPTFIDLSWKGGDYDPADNVYYNIYFGEEPDPPLIDQIGPFQWDQINIYYDLKELKQNTKYYWKIIATDIQGACSKSDIWTFTTK
jgi:hypothetical protein